MLDLAIGEVLGLRRPSNGVRLGFKVNNFCWIRCINFKSTYSFRNAWHFEHIFKNFENLVFCNSYKLYIVANKGKERQYFENELKILLRYKNH